MFVLHRSMTHDPQRLPEYESSRSVNSNVVTQCRRQTAPVSAVDDPDEAVRGFEVVAPVGAQRLLAAYVPNV